MSWLAALWSRAARWLEAGTPRRPERRGSGRSGAAADDRAGEEDAPWEPGSVAVLPTEPSIDLHHFHPRDVPSVVDEYLRAAHEAGLEEVLLIHGRGKGVQRSVVGKVLASHPLVERFGPGAGAAGQGATVAQLRRAKTQHKTKTSRPF